MFDFDNQGPAQVDPAAWVASAASVTFALIATFFTFPFVFHNSVGWIIGFTETHYGVGGVFASLVWFLWAMITLVALFTLTKLGLYYAIRLVGFWMGR